MRLADWEGRLSAYLADHTSCAVAWGQMDCVRFAAGAVKAMTGTDPLPKLTYKTEAGAWRALKRLGFTSLSQAVDAHLSPTHPAMARRGDVVMCDGALGVCIGGDALFLPVEGCGLIRRPRKDWTSAWAVL